MKQIYTTLILLLASSFSQAQNYPTEAPAALYSIDKVVTRAATAGSTTCAADTVRYVRDGKATAFIGITMNVPSEFAGYSQYYDAPQEMTVSGMCFYAGINSLDPLDTAIVKCRVFAANPDSTVGAVLTEKDIVVYNNYFPSNIDVMKYCVTFDSAVITNQPYYVSIWTETTQPLGIMTDDYNVGDGQNEKLGWWYWTGDSTWYASGQFFVWDVDWLIEPIASYELQDSVWLTADSTCAGTSFCAERYASPIVYNRMYNQDALIGNDSIPFAYDWDDGSTSIENDSCHIYTTAGNYSVALTTTVNGWTSNCSASAFVDHIVNDAPSAAFTSSTSQLDASFTDASTGIPTSYSWDFGDGFTSTTQSPTHTYTSAGTYTVCLIVTNACGGDTVCNPVTVCANPAADFTWSETNGTVDFTDASTGGSTTWSWDFGDSNTDNTQNPTHIYTATGTYYVCLITSNACGPDTICDSVTVCLNPTADFTWNSIGADASVEFTDASNDATSWSWDFGDGTGTSTDQNPTYVYGTFGWWTVCLTATNTCGSVTYCDSVESYFFGIEDNLLSNAISVYPNPTADNLTINIDLDQSTAINFQLVSVTGELVSEMSFGAVTTKTIAVDLSDVAQGVYYARFTSENGQTVKEIIKLK